MNKNNTLILVVDDSAAVRDVLERILAPEGYDVILAENGKEALVLIEHQKPDLILLDIILPEIDGYEVCEQLYKKIKLWESEVIFITGEKDSDSIFKGFEAGAVDYITKPFNYKELLLRIKNHLKRLKLQRELQESQEKLKNSNLAKDKFFSIVGHDLRAPFNELVGVTELLDKRYDRLSEEEVKDYIGLLKESSLNAMDLLNNLLQWGRFQVGAIKYSPQKVQLKKIIDESIWTFESQILKKEIEVKSTIPEDCYTNSDDNMLAVICRNLISNAVKFTSKEGIVLISSKETEGFLEIKIKDTGVGIPADKVELILKDEQSHYTTVGTDGEPGSGLGLNLCKEFIKKNGGFFKIESREGIGSCFYFTVPLAG